MDGRRTPRFLAKVMAAFYDKKSDVKLGNFRRRDSICGEICEMVFGYSTSVKRQLIYSRWHHNWGGVKELFALEQTTRSKEELSNTSNLDKILSFIMNCNEEDAVKSTVKSTVKQSGSTNKTQVISINLENCYLVRKLKIHAIDTDQGFQEALTDKKVKIEFVDDLIPTLHDVILTTEPVIMPKIEAEESGVETMTASEVGSLCEADTSSEFEYECKPLCKEEYERFGNVENFQELPCEIREPTCPRDERWNDVDAYPNFGKIKRSMFMSGTISRGLRFDKCKVLLVNGVFKFDTRYLEKPSKESHCYLLDLIDKFTHPCAIQIKSKRYHRPHVMVYAYCKVDGCRLFACRLFKSSPTHLKILSNSETASHSRFNCRRVFGTRPLPKRNPLSRLPLVVSAQNGYGLTSASCNGRFQAIPKETFLRSRLVCDSSEIKYDLGEDILWKKAKSLVKVKVETEAEIEDEEKVLHDGETNLSTIT